MLALVAGIGLFLQVGTFAPPPSQQQVTVHSDVTVNVPPPDPEATAEMAGWSFSGIVVTVITPTLVKWTNDVLNIPDFVRTTPPDLTYQNGTVREMADLIRKVALGLMVVALLAWAFTALIRGESAYWGKIVLGSALAIGNMIWWQWGIQLNNAICNAIAAPTVDSIARAHLTVPQITDNPIDAFGPAVLVIATCIVVLLLAVSMLFRLGFLDVLIVAGSLALFCKSSEHTERFASTYIGMATGTLFSQIMVVVALKLATVFGVIAGGIGGTLIGLVVLLLARKMPGILSSRFGQQAPSATRIAATGTVIRRLVAKI